MTKKLSPELRELMDGPPATPGRKAFQPAPTLDAAMAALAPPEAEFARHVLAGDQLRVAYSKAYPASRTPGAQQAGGVKLAQRARVAHALRLGRAAGAVTALAGLAYDVKAADEQLVELIDEAREADQYSAVANMVRERLRLHKLTDNAPAAMAGASFTLVIRGADGAEKTITPDIVDVQAREVDPA